MTYRTNGHGNVAMGPDLDLDRVWDLQYVKEIGEQGQIQGGGAGGGHPLPWGGGGQGVIFFKISKYMRKHRVL